MNDLIKARGGALAEFDPLKTKEKISVLKAAILHAENMRKWEEGELAVEWMVDEQKKFVAWWNESVSPGKHNRKVSSGVNLLSCKKAEEETGVTHVQVSRWRKELARPGYDKRLFKPSYKKAMGGSTGGQERTELHTGEMEWYTPSEYVERARNVMGGIDLDPASCEMAQTTINAKKFFTFEDDGLAQKWFGRVWLNPPYAGKLVSQFAEKMASSWEAGALKAAVMLTNAYTETSWFHRLANASNAMCFTRGRIKFESPHGEKCAPTNGQCFYYFGDKAEEFAAEYASIGIVVHKL